MYVVPSGSATPCEVSEERFEALVADALDSIPDELGRADGERRGRRRGLADDGAARRPAGTLLGLYEGIDLTRRSPSATGGDAGPHHDLPRPAVPRSPATRPTSRAQVRVTVLHEVGHYFGMTTTGCTSSAGRERCATRQRALLAELGPQPALRRRRRSTSRAACSRWSRSVGAAARAAGQTVKVVGVGPLVLRRRRAPTGRMLRIGALDRLVAIDRDAMTVDGRGRHPALALNEELGERGLALSNLGDIDRQTIAGATSTGTHGTGLRYGSIAAAIVGMEIVTGRRRGRPLLGDRGARDLRAARGSGSARSASSPRSRCSASRCSSCARSRSRMPLGRVPRRAGTGSSTRTTTSTATGSRTPTTCTVKIEQPHRRRRSARSRATRSGRARSTTATYAIRRDGRAAAGCARSGSRSSHMQLIAGGFGTAPSASTSATTCFCTPPPRALRRDGVRDPRADMATALLRRPRRSSSAEGLLVDFPIEIRGIGRRRHPAQHGSRARDLLPRRAPLRRHAGHVERYFHGVEAIMDGLGGRPHWGKMHFQTAATLAPRYPEWIAVPARVRGGSIRSGRFRNAYLDRILGRCWRRSPVG